MRSLQKMAENQQGHLLSKSQRSLLLELDDLPSPNP
uniref:Uncharacterized protein n=1 Tax=Arundo donax TaxID=35708 RepID=A0A0A9SKS6_ARUDO